MTQINTYDNTRAIQPPGAVIKPLGTSGREFRKLCRLVEISGLAGYLRNFQISLLTEDERKRFLEFQDFLINLEAKCFDEFGFVR